MRYECRSGFFFDPITVPSAYSKSENEKVECACGNLVDAAPPSRKYVSIGTSVFPSVKS
jgi:hypothetical protein